MHIAICDSDNTCTSALVRSQPAISTSHISVYVTVTVS